MYVSFVGYYYSKRPLDINENQSYLRHFIENSLKMFTVSNIAPYGFGFPKDVERCLYYHKLIMGNIQKTFLSETQGKIRLRPGVTCFT